MTSRYSLTSALAFTLALQCSGLKADETENAVIAEKVQAALKAYKSCSIDATFKVEQVGRSPVAGASKIVREAGVRRSSNRTRLFQESLYRLDSGELGKSRQENILLLSGEVLSGQRTPETTSGADAGSVLVQYFSNEIAGKQAVNINNVAGSLPGASLLLWNVGRTPLSEYYSDASETQVSNLGAGNYSLKSTSKYGTASMVVSESSGWLPTELVVQQQAESMTPQGPISSFYDNSQDSTVPTIVSITTRIKASDFEPTDTTQIAPRRLICKTTETYKNRNPVSVDRDYRITRLSFKEPLEDSDFKLGFEIPPGTPITVVGAEHLGFEWDGEHPVAKVTPLSTTALRTTSRATKWLFSGAGLISINIVFLSLLLLMLWRRSSAH